MNDGNDYNCPLFSHKFDFKKIILAIPRNKIDKQKLYRLPANKIKSLVTSLELECNQNLNLYTTMK